MRIRGLPGWRTCCLLRPTMIVQRQRGAAPLFGACLVLFIFGGCSGSSGGGSSKPIAFHGQVQPLAGFSFDTGPQPSTGPANIDLKLAANGTATIDAAASVSGGKLAGTAGSGHLHLDVHFALVGKVHVETPLKTYDGDVPGLMNIDVPIQGDASFDPFLTGDGQTATVTANIPETPLPDVPLGAVPGKLTLTVATGSVLTSVFHGTCVSVKGGNAQYLGQTTTSGTLVLKGAIVLDLPAPLDKSVDIPDIMVAIPSNTQAMDLGTQPAPGASDGQQGACSASSDDGGMPDGAQGDAGVTGDGGGGDAGSTDDGGGDSGSTGDGGGDVLDSLALYYKFDETSGTTASDASGQGHDGTLQGNATWDPNGKQGGGLHFDGVDAYVDAGNLGALSAWTVAVWMRSEAVVDDRFLFDGNVSDSNRPGPAFLQSANGGGGLDLNLGTSTLLVGSVAAAQWHHAAATYDGQAHVYLDGVPQLTSAVQGAPPQFASVVVGKGNEGAGANPAFFQGTLDEVRVYGRTLSDAEIAAVYAATK
jgi:hypothetical protein